MAGDFFNIRRVSYGGDDNGIGVAVFIPVCTIYHRFVTPDESVAVNEARGLNDQPNATCKKCGRTWMVFEGFF